MRRFLWTASKKLLELYELHKDEDNVLDIIENTFAQAGDERTRLSIKAKLSNLGFDVGPTQKWTTEVSGRFFLAYVLCQLAMRKKMAIFIVAQVAPTTQPLLCVVTRVFLLCYSN